MATDSKIGILIEAKDQASTNIKNVSSNLKEIDGAAGIAAGAINGLVSVLGTVGAVELGKQFFELAKLGAGAQEAKASFDDLASSASQSGDAMLAALQKSSGGLVTNTDLVLSANKAMLLGVATSADQMGKLMEIARVRSDAMGQSVGTTFDQIVEGIGRMSSRMLVGVAGLQDEQVLFEAYAASVHKTAAELTDAEKKQILFNAVVAESAGLVDRASTSADSNSDKFDQLGVSIDNARTAFGQFATVVLTTNLAGSSSALDLLTQQLKGLTQFGAATPLVLWQGVLEKLGVDAGLTADQMAQLDAIFGQTSSDAQRAADAAERHSERLIDLAGAARRAAAAIDITSEAIRGGTRAAITAELALADLQVQFNNASTALGQKRFFVGGVDPRASDEILGRILDDRRAAAAESERLAREEASTYESEMKKAAAATAKAFEDLKGKVSGVLSGARTDIGINVDDLLPREDAVNENARRLADIAVNGFKGQDWMAEFKAEVPEAFKQVSESADPKGTAARMLKEFQDGLQPELIDKEKAKDLVRKMIFGDQQADQLATEIATELAQEFGTAAPANLNELVGQALGTGTKGAGATGGATAGADAATSFTQSFTSAASGIGAQIAASLKVDSVIALIKDAGKAAGETWSDMFLSVVGDHVPDSLVSLLTDLVTPGVQARLATQTSLTAAK